MSAPKYINKLQGKKVIVIGGSAGIGYCAAEASLESGSHVYIASSSSTRVDKAVAQLQADAAGTEAVKGSIQGREIDLTSDESVEQFIAWVSGDTVAGKDKGVDHIIFTAGDALQLGDLMETDFEDARKAFDVRFWGALRVIQIAHPEMKDRGRLGSITITSNGRTELPAYLLVYRGPWHTAQQRAG
ncbi:hypothetical protein QFC22_006193 [Naganishia vaughanmartiniae]|uniref:Uncharacterized protein n=1 Tax=Naganishia vaughanmartiniae TaxID=1424756 RepID=A0ACC2WPE0_9TREE|nr:hypothetical protein QFC22_006193 [Naganishia vaughanmartiniae]